MLRQYAEQSPPETATPSGDTPTAHPTGSGLPGWRIATRRVITTVAERTLGECLAPTPTIGLLVMAAIAGLLAIIAVTLSPGNALLVLLAGIIMRLSCEHRSRR
jgi:hypothetical protein